MIESMNTYIIAVAVVLLIVYLWKKLKERVTTPKEVADSNTSQQVVNDKLIIVEDVKEEEISKIVQDFCDAYNKERTQVLPRLVQLSNNRYAIHFPKNITFEILAFFVNYIQYPISFQKEFSVTAWTTAKLSKIDLSEKRMMLYLSKNDTECDNVFLITEEGVTIKYDFGGKQLLIPENLERTYIEPDVSIDEIRVKDGVDFK